MRYTGLVGCTLQGIGPIALLIILRMRQHPQLGIVAFVGAMSYVMNLLCSSMWWWIFEANFMWHIATNVVTHLFMRCFLFFGYMKAEGIFLKNGEVICASNYGLSHVALALGVGYGLMEVFLTFGTLLFSDYNIGPPFATLYDPSRCTSMTTIYWQSFTSSIFSLLHPMWMMAFFIAMESLLFRQTSHEEDTSEDKLPSRQLRRWITTVVPQNRFPKRRLSRRCAIGLLLLIITLQSASIFLTTCTCQISIIPLALILIATYGTILVCASRVYVPFRPIRSGPECVPTAQSVPSPGVSETEALITQIQSTA